MIPLFPPPSYEYQSQGPWMITQQYGERTQTWVMHTLVAAVRRFWLLPDHAIIPDRRVCIDAHGSTIIGWSPIPDACPRVVGTREAFDIVLRYAGVDQVNEILPTMELLRECDGVLF